MPDSLTIQVNEDEAALIARLREFSYGNVIIYKIKGNINRIEVTSSEMLNIMNGRKLANGNQD